jgi:hypothetical protein
MKSRWFTGDDMLNPEEESVLAELFSHQAVDAAVALQMQEIRVAALALATVILENCPRSIDRGFAIRKVREAVFWANGCIALGGRNLP